MDINEAIEQKKISLSDSDKFFLLFTPLLIIVSLIAGLYLIYVRHLHDPMYVSDTKESVLLGIILFIFLLIISLYQLTQINEYNKLTIVYSTLETEKKMDIINSLTQKFKWTAIITDNPNYFRFFHQRYLFGMDFIVIILIDKNGFYINVAAPMLKFPDIGFYKRFVKKIVKQINFKNQLL